MKKYVIPKAYQSSLDLKATQAAIKLIKDTFQTKLAKRMNLLRVSAPLFVKSTSGINDNLSGVEHPVSFAIQEEPGLRTSAEIVHSLAKWKRLALKQYEFEVGTGLYADMNAIRADETPDNVHSFYVDQWDWEKVMQPEDRTLAYLQETVQTIYAVMLDLETVLDEKLDSYHKLLPPEISFVTTQELEDRYPDLDPRDREHEIAKEKKAVFLIGVGADLKSGKPHDLRAPDYDDWRLNGDIIVWDPVLDDSLELSSMGIRVDKDTLLEQLKLTDNLDRLSLPFHTKLAANELPQTIGGGIGQSRLCMFFLQKAHIGEVQASIWPEHVIAEMKAKGVTLL